MRDDLRAAIKAIYRPGDVVELRAFGPGGIRRVGRFKFGWELVDATEAENVVCDCYWTLNPTSLPPSPMTDGGQGTREGDVPWRRFFLLDFDPIRPYKIATDEEFAAAKLQAELARAVIQAHMGGTAPIMASSGNGVHLLVPIDMPNDPKHKELIKGYQKFIAKQFSTNKVVCECFCDAARITRAYSTYNRKAPETATHKHRRSGLL
jgi:hypothetical protein